MRGTYTRQITELLEADKATLPTTQYLQINAHIDDTAWSNDRVSLTDLCLS